MLGGSFAAALVMSLLAIPAVNSAAQGYLSAGGMWFPALIQLLGLGYFSPASAQLQVNLQSLSSSDGPVGATLFAWPALVPLAGLIAVAVMGRRIGGNLKAPTWAPRLVLSAATGLAAATVLTVLAAAIPLSADVGSVNASLRAASFLGFLAATLIVGSTVFVALLPSAASPRRRLTRATITTVLEHVTTLGALLGMAAIVVMAVKSPENLFLIPVLIPMIALDGFGMVHLVPLEYGAGNSSHEYLSIFSDSANVPGWIWSVILLLVILWILVIALRWRARRGMPGNKASGWVILPAAYALLGVVLTVGSIVTGSAEVPRLGSSAFGWTLSLAPWGFLAFALLGLLIEVLSRFVMVPLAASLPPGLYNALTWRIPAQPVAPETTDPAGQPSPPTPGTPEAPQGTPQAASPWNSVPQPAPQGNPTSQANPAASDTTTSPAESGSSAAAPVGAPLASGRAAMNPATKRRWVLSSIVVGVVAVLVIAGSITVNALGSGAYGPQKKVEAYLQALVDGKAGDAAKILDPNVTDDKRVFLTDAVYSKAENRPSGFTMGETDVDEKTATVSARVTQNGKEFPLTFRLEKEGKQAVIFDDWRVSDGPAFSEIEYSQGAETLTVNGTDVKATASFPLDAPQGSDAGAPPEPYTYPVYPGTYTFSAPKGSKYVSFGEDIKVTVNPDGTVDQMVEGADSEAIPIAFRQSYTQAAIDDASSQVNERIKSCVGTTEQVPAKCKTASWEYDFGGASEVLSRTWSETPSPVVVNVDPEYNYIPSEQPELSSLSGPLVVAVPNAGISVKFRYKSVYGTDNKWTDSISPDIYDPFMVSDGSFGSRRLTFPVKIEGDVLTVDTSAIDTENTRNMNSD